MDVEALVMCQHDECGCEVGHDLSGTARFFIEVALMDCGDSVDIFGDGLLVAVDDGDGCVGQWLALARSYRREVGSCLLDSVDKLVGEAVGALASRMAAAST